MYADDLVLISPSPTGLQELIHACECYSEEHDIMFNSKKSSVLICRNKTTMHAITTPSCAINGNVIEESLKVKYLGHIICNDLTDDDDMMRQRRQLYAQGNVISRRFYICSVEVTICCFILPVHICIRASYGGSLMHRVGTS